ncbi:MAG: hypothetical protein H0U34_06875 [Sphingomonas sp.]|nr:hypothetical protein [Sphingomonas sp.]
MRRALVISLLALGLAACQAGQPEQDQNLSERGSSPEVATGTGDVASGTLPATEQGQMGDTMPDEPAGPRGDRASGTGGDTLN